MKKEHNGTSGKKAEKENKAKSRKKNMAKYESYKLAFGQIKNAIAKGFHIEAIALEESIISDRLQSAAEGMGIVLKSTRNGRSADFSELAKLPSKEPGFQSLCDLFAERSLTTAALVEWGLSRNDFIHNVAHGAPGGKPAIPACEFSSVGKAIAINGLKLARTVCDWSKSCQSDRRKVEESRKCRFRLFVTASRAVDIAHCDYSCDFDDPGHRAKWSPSELVSEFGGVYDSHGIAIPLNGSLLHVEAGDCEEKEIRLDDSEIGIAFIESRIPEKNKDPVMYARATWDDQEWQMSELPDSTLDINGRFDIHRMSIGIRLVPDMKGGVEKLVSHILYAGRVIHAPYVQTIGRGAKSKFWTLQNGKWKKMSTSLLKMKIRENVDKFEAASFFGK